ncbi:MAG TPA: phosphatidate cytidylyltransferase [Dehalococcoidia bacterium]|nr:phosphatidate cytidylyltransferase [Dehalococcoidia bacterium]
MLKKRIITAFCLLPVLVVAVWFDEPLPWLTVVAAVWGVLAALEFYRAIRESGIEPLNCFGLIFILLLIISPHCSWAYVNPLLLTSMVVLPPLLLLVRRRKEDAFIGWVWTVAGIIYIGWLLSHFVALRGLEHGREWVLFALFVTFASDTAAYFIGRAFGRHPLAPDISPRKTREGAIGGVIGAVIAGLLLVLILNIPIDYGAASLLALAISIFGQVGDLFESLFKRNMGVKDSGRYMPGHGGFLDRMDSVVFAGVVVYYYVIWLI